MILWRRGVLKRRRRSLWMRKRRSVVLFHILLFLLPFFHDSPPTIFSANTKHFLFTFFSHSYPPPPFHLRFLLHYIIFHILLLLFHPFHNPLLILFHILLSLLPFFHDSSPTTTRRFSANANHFLFAFTTLLLFLFHILLLFLIIFFLYSFSTNLYHSLFSSYNAYSSSLSPSLSSSCY